MEPNGTKLCYKSHMKTQTKKQNGGWAGKEQRKLQAGQLNKIAKSNKGKNLLSSERLIRIRKISLPKKWDILSTQLAGKKLPLGLSLKTHR